MPLSNRSWRSGDSGNRSKRSAETSLASQHNKKLKSGRGSSLIEDGSLLVECLRDHKLYLHTGETPHLLGVDQATFIKTFSKDVSTSLEYPNNIESMLETLFEYLRDQTFLRKSLNSTKTSPDSDTARNEFQDSLIRLLLCVPDLQPKLLVHLLEVLADLAAQQNRPTQRSQTEECSLPRMILSSIRFLPYIKDGAGLEEKMMEILPSCTVDVQREIILSLPDILDDSQHEKVANSLKVTLDETSELTCTILDCLTNLSLDGGGVLKELLGIVLKRLDRIDLDDLPTVVEFIISTSQGGDYIDVVQELRDRLDLSPPNSSQTDQRTQSRRKETKDVQCIVVENIYLQSLINKPFCDAWLKCIEASVEDPKPLDVLILICFEGIHGRRKNIENVFKNKIRHGVFTVHLLRQTFGDFNSVIKKYFSDFITVCDALLRSNESNISHFGMLMYREAFASFSVGHAYYQQEIIGDLVSKVGTGGGGLITDGALRSLESIAENHSKELAVFTTMITAMMDFTENMNLGQFRQLMHILCSLAWRTGDATTTVGGLQTEVEIMMKKQLGNKSTVLKKKGVIAVVNAVRAMGRSTTNDTLDNTNTSTSAKLSKKARGTMKLLELAIAQTASDPEAAGLFMDELASPASIAELGSEIAELCSKMFQSKFEDDFVEDINQETLKRTDLLLPINLDFNLDEEEEEDSHVSDDSGGICIPIAKWVLEAKNNPAAIKTDMLRFIPNFRLLGAISQDHLDIDALLGCGILMVPEENMSGRRGNLSSVQLDAVCDIVFLCLNWFREIINFYSRIDDEETRKKVMIRLKNVLTLEERLKGLLYSNTQYRPPNILFSEDTTGWNPPHIQDKSKAKKKGAGKKGGKGKKTVQEGRMDESSMNATVHLTTQATQGGPVASSTLIGQSKLESAVEAEGPSSVQLAAYRPFFRELDLEVFKIFNFVVVTTESEPSYDEEKGDPQFRPSELLFLLKDLAIKVDKRLISTGKKKGFPSHGVSPSSFGFTNLMSVPEDIVVDKLAHILPKLFANLDILKEYFERLIQLNDGIMDSSNMYNDTSAQYLQCLKNGFDTSTSFFSWNGFQSSEMSGVLLSCLKGFVERLQVAVTESEARDLKLLTEKTVEYLLTFSESILSSEVACSHLSLLNAVAKLDTTSQKNKMAVADTAQGYSKRNWQTALGKETGAKFNVHVEKFFRMSLEYAEDPMSEMTEIFDVGVPDVFQNRGKEFSNETYQTISRGTLGVLYQVALIKLGNLVKKMTYGTTKDMDDLLEDWTKSTSLLQKIINPLKVWRNRAILKAVLKHSKPFIDHFLKHGMPLMENAFKRRSADCIDVIKTLQSSTRYLQVICTSAKTDNDIALANYVPILKKSLETSVYRVHAMLAANDCGSAFWLGNLKNKDLEGQEILSQVTEEDEEEEEEEEEGDNDEEVEEEEGEEDPRSEGEMSGYNDKE